MEHQWQKPGKPKYSPLAVLLIIIGSIIVSYVGYEVLRHSINDPGAGMKGGYPSPIAIPKRYIPGGAF